MHSTYRSPQRARRAGIAPACEGRGRDPSRLLAVGATLVALSMIAGCASTGDEAAPAARRTPGTLGLADGFRTSTVDAQWWHRFADAQLDAFVAKALADSPTLHAAQDRLTHALAVVGARRGVEAPQVGFDASTTRQRLTENGLFPPPYGGAVFNNPTANFTLAWDLDLFGRQKADLASAIGNARAQQADADVAAQQLAVQVVRTYVQLARLGSQREIAQRTLEQRTQMLTLIVQRVKAGIDTVVEQRQGEGAIPEARTQIESLDEQIELTRHGLAALTAQPMDALAGVSPTLAQLHLPAQPAVLGADLIARRPDIAAALARVEASEQAVKSQRAQFYPDINFSAAAGLSSLEFDSFAKWGSRAWQFGPALHLPLFEGGTLRAELRGKGADRDVAIESYNQLLVDAVREAADAATSAASIQRQQVHQAQALTAAESSYQYAQQRYAQGLGNNLIVLNAETQMLAERRLDVDLRYRALDVQAQLMKALGGGWDATAAAPAAAARNDNQTPA